MNKKATEKLVKATQNEAEKAIAGGDPPFGSVLADSQGRIIATAHNTQYSSNDPTAHAEINVLRKAGKKVGSPYLEGHHLFGNAEPCSMCMSAAIKAKIRHFYFGAPHESRMDPEIPATEVAKKSKRRLYLHPNILKESCAKQIKRGRKKLKENC